MGRGYKGKENGMWGQRRQKRLKQWVKVTCTRRPQTGSSAEEPLLTISPGLTQFSISAFLSGRRWLPSLSYTALFLSCRTLGFPLIISLLLGISTCNYNMHLSTPWRLFRSPVSAQYAACLPAHTPDYSGKIMSILTLTLPTLIFKSFFWDSGPDFQQHLAQGPQFCVLPTPKRMASSLGTRILRRRNERSCLGTWSKTRGTCLLT